MRQRLTLIILSFILHLVLSHQLLSCDINEIFLVNRVCAINEGTTNRGDTGSDEPVYVLYSVNPVEGFNLRRDVYLRMAIFLKNLRKVKGYSNAQLVLPVFHHLYHWKSHFRQSNMFWNHFFDLPSLKLFTNVIDMWEFFDQLDSHDGVEMVNINEVYVLQQFEAMFESGIFIDKFEETACTRNEYDNYHFLEYYNITERTITCLNFQGSASLLVKVLEGYKEKYQALEKPRVVLFAVSLLSLSRFHNLIDFNSLLAR